MLFGYSRRTANAESGLLELKEVTFDLEPRDLRILAAFLSASADQIESRELRVDHVHIESENPDWRSEETGADIIVFNRYAEPPIRIE